MEKKQNLYKIKFEELQKIAKETGLTFAQVTDVVGKLVAWQLTLED